MSKTDMLRNWLYENAGTKISPLDAMNKWYMSSSSFHRAMYHIKNNVADGYKYEHEMVYPKYGEKYSRHWLVAEKEQTELVF